MSENGQVPGDTTLSFAVPFSNSSPRDLDECSLMGIIPTKKRCWAQVPTSLYMKESRFASLRNIYHAYPAPIEKPTKWVLRSPPVVDTEASLLLETPAKEVEKALRSAVFQY